MSTAKQLSEHIRQFYQGGNWTCSTIKELLSDIQWEESLIKINGLNTIATLTYHIHYFVKVINKVLEGGPLEGSDKFSFDHPPIASQSDWDNIIQEVFAAGEQFAEHTAQCTEDQLTKMFPDEKYGSFLRNIMGIIEHSHYHLGQIAIIKKMIRSNSINLK